MSKHSLGRLLVEDALGDSYYPDLCQSVSAEKIVELIDTNPLIAAAPEMLAALKMAHDRLLKLFLADERNNPHGEPGECAIIRYAIKKAEGKV